MATSRLHVQQPPEYSLAATAFFVNRLTRWFERAHKEGVSTTLANKGMDMADIYTRDGNELSAGLQGCKTCDEAIQAAQRTADLLESDVHLVDDDGEWIVHPIVDGVREPADPI